MSRLLQRPQALYQDGLFQQVTPESAGWGTSASRSTGMEPGQRLQRVTGGREACLVLVAGRADVAANGQSWRGLGERMSPFEGKPGA